MLNAFLKFNDQHKIVAKSDKVLVAVSGGIDSVALARLFKDAGMAFGIAHCNFQLRGEESDGDEKFVTELAEALKVECHVKKFETLKVASGQGISTQMAARNLRYEWFDELLKSGNYNKLATAHHKNDNLETVIFNLAKGTGIAGFHGIKVKNKHIIRPLLFASREDIAAYAARHKLKWREDSSNASLKYRRNLVRNRIIPLLKEINPNLENTMEQTIGRISGVEDFFLQKVDEMRPQLLQIKDGDVWISLKKLGQLLGKEAVLAELLKEYGFTFLQARDVLSVVDDQPGKIFFSGEYVINVDRRHIIISEKNRVDDEEIIIPEKNGVFHSACCTLELERLKAADCELVKSNEMAFLDYDKIKFPLIMRKWKPGDRFSPLGMRGQKKLSDFMIDEKIPVNLKSKVSVLISEGKIVWVVGYRIDDRFKIEDHTKNILKIRKVPYHAEAV